MCVHLDAHWLAALKLGENCLYDQSCQYFDRYSVCALSDQGTAHECRCRAAFRPSITLESISQTSLCLPGQFFILPDRNHTREDLYWEFLFWFSIEPHGPWLKSDVPTVIGLGVGMSVFMALTCLVLRLFSRARFAQDQARGYGNAHLAPPTSTSTTINHTHTGLWATRTSLPRFDLLVLHHHVVVHTIREKRGVYTVYWFWLEYHLRWKTSAATQLPPTGIHHWFRHSCTHRYVISSL